jgi:hypothetical protein
MSDFPSVSPLSVPHLAGSLSPLNNLNPLAGLGFMADPTVANAVYPSANYAIFSPVVVPQTVTVYQMAWGNGVPSGNVDVGIYDIAGNRLVSSGSTAGAGSSTTQAVDITDTVLNPGIYFFAIACDNTTATFWRVAWNLELLRGSGVQGVASSFPLPSTVTYANPTQGYWLPVAASVINAI